jgi:hypothetical protein
MKAKNQVTKKKVSTAKKSPRKKVAAPLAPITMTGNSVAHGHTSYDHNADLKLNDKNKKLIMWLGVSVIMAAVVIGWILNLNQIVNSNAFVITPTNSQASVDFDNLKKNLEETIGEVKGGFKDLESLTPSSTATPTTTITPSVTTTALPNTLPN